MADTALTPEEITQQATSEVGASLTAQTAPLQSERDQAALDEQRSVQSISSMFDSILPYASAEASAVEQSYQGAEAAQKSIFEAAQNNFNQLKQARASEAQQLAQKMGGPVALSEFNDLMPQAEYIASQGPREQMYGLGQAQAGAQLARAYSGKVLPGLQVELTTKTRQSYEDQIKNLSKEIDRIQGTRGTEVQNRINDLTTRERSFQLDQARLDLDRLKAERDWAATKRSLSNEDARLGLARKEFGLSQAGVTGQYKGKPTLTAKRLTADEKQAARRMGLSDKQYALALAKAQTSAGVQQQKLTISQQKNAMEILDHATNPNSGKPITMTVRVPVSKIAGEIGILKPSSGVYHDKDGYYKYQPLTLSPQQWAQRGGYTGQASITDPNKLYELLLGSNVPPKMALNLVRAKTGMNDFSPGPRQGVTAEELAGMPFNEVRGIAMQRGFKPDKKSPRSKQQLIDFILHASP